MPPIKRLTPNEQKVRVARDAFRIMVARGAAATSRAAKSLSESDKQLRPPKGKP